MPDSFTLTCPNCGGKLEITNDIDRFVCAHCGTEHLVNRTGGIISLKPLLDDISREVGNVAKGASNTASELALKRLDGEISQLQRELGNVRVKIMKYDYRKNTRAVGKPVLIIGFVLTLLSLIIRIGFDDLGLGICGIGGILLVAGLIMRLFNGTEEEMKPWKEKEEKLILKLADLEDQRSYHHDNVNQVD